MNTGKKIIRKKDGRVVVKKDGKVVAISRHGGASNFALYTDEKIEAIRKDIKEALKKGVVNQSKIAAKHHVHQSTVYRIMHKIIRRK